MNEIHAIFVLGKQLSARRKSGETLSDERILVGQSWVFPSELADAYEDRCPPPPKVSPPDNEAAARYARFLALPEEVRNAPIPSHLRDDALFSRACRGFDELIAAARSFNWDHVGNSIQYSRWKFISPESTPKDKLLSVTGVMGGLGRGEWDGPLIVRGGLSYQSYFEMPVWFFEYLESLPFGETDLQFIRDQLSQSRKSAADLAWQERYRNLTESWFGGTSRKPPSRGEGELPQPNL